MIDRDELIRAALHFPWGIVGAALTAIGPAYGVIFSVAFLTYEVLEDWRLKDRSYKDVLGFLAGFGIGGAGLGLLRTLHLI